MREIVIFHQSNLRAIVFMKIPIHFQPKLILSVPKQKQ